MKIGAGLVPDIEDTCTLCVPLPNSISGFGTPVSVYPMKAERKKAREETDVVCVVEWRGLNGRKERERWFLLVQRPEGGASSSYPRAPSLDVHWCGIDGTALLLRHLFWNDYHTTDTDWHRESTGLLASLDEFPTAPNVSASVASPSGTIKIPHALLSTLLRTPPPPYIAPASISSRAHKPSSTSDPTLGVCGEDPVRIVNITTAGDVAHVFSHIRKTYRVLWVLLEGGRGPPELVPGVGSDSDVGRGQKGSTSAKSRVNRKGKGKKRDSDAEGGALENMSLPSPGLTPKTKWVPLDDVADAK